MKSRLIYITLIGILAIGLAGCGSIGSILGDQSGSSVPSQGTTNTLQGSVDRVDTRNMRIDLLTTDNSGRQALQSVPYDSRTRVTYQGQTGTPAQLERGDQVYVRLVNNGSNYIADTIEVTQSMSSSSSTYPTYPSNSNYGEIRGTVSFVDTTNRRIDLNASYTNNLRNSTANNAYTIYYDNNTRVLYQGRTYNVSDLERGDEVSIRMLNTNSSNMADTITVVRNVRQ